MTEVTDNQRYGMIEAIAHLINRDYERIGDDFVNMDFIPRGVDTRPIVPALTKVFDVALAGGGAKSINFQELAADLAEITYEFPFQIPPYFARRLMTDDSPRLRAALRYMVYGREGSFNAEKLIDLLQALEKFTAIKDEGDGSAFKVDGVRGSKDVGKAGDFVGSQQVDVSDRDTDVGGGKFRVSSDRSRSIESFQTDGGNDGSEDDEKTVREALRFFLSPEGAVFREFMLEEIVTVVDASSREAAQELVR